MRDFFRHMSARMFGLLVMAGLTGALSFAHLREVATAAGQSGWQSWAYPVSVDLLMTFAWLRLRNGSKGDDGRGAAWFWFLLALVASLGANIATAGVMDLHAPPLWLMILVAGWPAISFLGGVLLVHAAVDGIHHDDAEQPGASPATSSVPAVDAMPVVLVAESAPAAGPVVPERPATMPAKSGRAAKSRTATGSTAAASGRYETAMRAFWDAERAAGRTPSGADLNRAAGLDPNSSTGRKASRRYRAETTETATPAGPVPLRPVPNTPHDTTDTPTGPDTHSDRDETEEVA